MANKLKRKTTKQKILEFARLYFISGNASEAAERIGVSKKNASTYGKRFLARPEVIEYLADAKKTVDEITIATKEKILEELTRIAFGDLRKVVSWGPSGVIFKDSDTLPLDDALTIEEVSQGADTPNGRGALKIKRASKIEALKLLGMEHGMFQKNAVGSKENPFTISQPIVLSGDSEV